MNQTKIDQISSVAYSFKETVINSYQSVISMLDNKTPGAIVECGVGAGAQILAMQMALVDRGEKRVIWAFDSFEGIPMAGPNDTTQPGIGKIEHDVHAPIESRLRTSGITAHTQEAVQKNFINHQLPIDNVVFVKGWFQHTLPGNASRVGEIAILRLDGDLYESTKICLEHLYPSVVDGGIVIIDDYNLPGARQAFDEYFAPSGYHPEVVKLQPYDNGVHWFRKNVSRGQQAIATLDNTPIERYSQNDEQDVILGYFNGEKGGFLDIGANDGKTFSNSYGLLLKGWKGVMVEPSQKAFTLLRKNLFEFIADDKVLPLSVGISEVTGEVEFWESGSFGHTGPDVALLSCIDPKEKERWGDTVAFEKTTMQSYTFVDFMKLLKQAASISGYKVINQFDFINIDAEGMDYEILKQIDLTAVGCRCLCIEHNGVQASLDKYIAYATNYHLVEVSRNAENIIFVKPKMTNNTMQTNNEQGANAATQTGEQAPQEKRGVEQPPQTRGSLTFGERAVGLTFNPSSLPEVDEVKRQFARIIDSLHQIRQTTDDGEVKRMISVAITEAQASQLWAVKAITWNA